MDKKISDVDMELLLGWRDRCKQRAANAMKCYEMLQKVIPDGGSQQKS